MNAAQICQSLEGIVGNLAVSGGNPAQDAMQWLQSMKDVIRMPGNRDATDWAYFVSTEDLDETEETVGSAAAATLYGVLGINKDTDDSQGFSTYNAAAPTVAAGDLNDGGVLTTYNIAVFNGAISYAPVVLPGGIYHDTGLTIAATATDEGAVAASSAKAIVVYRQ